MSKPSRRASRGTARPGTRPTTATDVPSTGRPSGTRVGRRERARTGYADRSFFQRYRGVLLTLAVVVAVGVVGAFAIQAATAKTWECGQLWEPSPTPSADPSASPRFGYQQPDMGANHAVGNPQTYAYCPPASGNHWSVPGRGPIDTRFYGPDDFTEPAGWIHNLEHGALVVLYRGREGDPGLTPEIQEQMRSYWGQIPNSPVCNLPPGAADSPVIARFDDMAYPFAALVWNRVLPLESWDREAIDEFWLAEGEHESITELPCNRPTPTPGPSTPAPSGSAPSGSVAPSGSAPAASASPAASPASS